MTVKITTQDFLDKRTLVCKRAQGWFRRQGLDWNRFKREGMTADELRSGADPDQIERINRLEKVAIEREARRGRK